MASLEKQHLLLSNFISNSDVAALTLGIVKPEYFDARYREAAKFILDYTNQYKSIPSPEVIKVETGVELVKREIIKAEVDYTAKEIGKFCKRAAIEKVILTGANMLGDEAKPMDDDSKFGELEFMLKEAVAVGLKKDLGLNYFEDPHKRMEDIVTQAVPISTGWLELDDIIGGGLNRQEMILFGAASGRGKSIVMANLAVNLLVQGYNVLYISLELSELIVSKRFDAMITRVPYAEIIGRANEVADQILVNRSKMGALQVKRMPESVTTANDIRAYLKEYELVNGFVPDVICIDYVDLMASNRQISAENMFTKDKYVTEEIRALANDYNAMVVTAVQLGKGSEKLEDKDISQSNIQGGSSKVNTTDNFIGIIQSEAQMAAGEYVFKALKTRSSGGLGRTCVLKWNPKILRITELNSLDFRKDKPKTPSAINMPEGASPSSGNSNVNSVLGILDGFQRPKL